MLEMTLTAPGRSKPVVVLNRSEVPNFARAIGYALTANFLNEYGTLNASFGTMRPAKVIVYLVIILATVQKHMRGVAPEKLGTQPFTAAECGQISRRAIAESTGIPRENVRRLVKELITDGRIEEAERGYVRLPLGFMLNPGRVDTIDNLLHGFVRTMQALVDMGVVRVVTTSQGERLEK